jgi:pyruvate/2-oxoglutarate dehydrogenase complex dihydrolipoamide dehydrogenase (E3) component
MLNFDAIIIGTGQSGPALARRLVAAGWKVAIIERKLFGGTCINTGCTPTKTLIASAHTAYVARRAADYGVRIEGSVKVDMKAVKARKDAVVAAFHNGVERSLKTLQGCTVYQGQLAKRVVPSTLHAVAHSTSHRHERRYCLPAPFWWSSGAQPWRTFVVGDDELDRPAIDAAAADRGACPLREQSHERRDDVLTKTRRKF